MNIKSIAALAAAIVATSAWAAEPAQKKCGAGSCSKKVAKAASGAGSDASCSKKEASCSKHEGKAEASCSKKEASCSKKDASCSKK